MKTAQQWQEELAGETSVQSIQRIQADALLHAITSIRHSYSLLEFASVGSFSKILVQSLSEDVARLSADKTLPH